MFITICDVLKMERFENVEVIAGHSGLSRRVENVYFMEVPDIYAYIDQNGLLLTTLYPVADKPALIQTLIPKLAEMNLAGIAIKPGRYVAEIPEIMVKQANELGIPLLKLPNDANLSTLANQVLTKFLDVKTSLLEFRNKMHQQLLELLLEGTDVNKFIHSIASLVNAPVLLLNNDFDYVGSSIQKGHEIIVHHKPTNSNSNKNTFSVQVGKDIYEKNDLFIQCIYASGNEYGFLVVLLDKEKNLTENMIIAIEQASFIIAFLFQTEETLLQKERNHLSSFVRDIIHNQYTSQTEMIEKAKVFRWNLQFPLVLLNIKTSEKESEKKLAIFHKMLDSGHIERAASKIVDVPIENCKILYINDSLVCFISLVSEIHVRQKLHNLGNMILFLFEKYGNLGVSISDTIHHFKQIKEYYDNSTLVFKVYKENLHKQSYVHFYSDIGLFRLFHYVENLFILEDFVNEKLGKVFEYDKKKNTNLLETLRYYIQNNTNMHKTAEDMFVHYNTMRYRINKLKELGIDGEDGFELTEIALAYQLHQYLQLKKG
ncbi:PucR family transcriptional regulator [Lysinibacillus sp. JNUCC-52]|uniref:PucR family transcriptional regulator n=1 Tax=Lysinibacillus sp. JNUCC-52 TaxID=2792480 RepID=UPI001936D8ED|nr:PucR family transcriptional regulator [Lysinibacillus sp. JNUCC-52]